MTGETANHIIGYTHNPKNRLLSAGGSSGGEGSLIALRGSPVGIASDLEGAFVFPLRSTESMESDHRLDAYPMKERPIQ